MSVLRRLPTFVLFAFLAGCGSLPMRSAVTGDGAPVIRAQKAEGDGKEPAKEKEEENGDKNGDKDAAKPPKTLFDWQIGPPKEEEEEEDEEEPLATDRPDFVEASSNVGAGRVQLEMGYTYIEDRENGVTRRQHSYPEMLLRVGLWVDWLELRVGQNFGNERTRTGADRTSFAGAEDLYLGLGVALTEQKGFLPESRIVFQMDVPTGASAFTADEVLPGFNYLYGWDIVPDFLSLGASSQINRARDDEGHYYTELAQAVTVGIAFSKKLGSYIETFAFFPHSARAADAGPEYYLDGGLTYKFTPNFQVDVRVGTGLNRRADDFFAGSGFAVRY